MISAIRRVISTISAAAIWMSAGVPRAPAEPTEVWEALTEPERLEEWFANDVELEPVPGGRGVFRWDDGEERIAAVEAVDPERPLTVRWTDGSGEVGFTLERVSGGTRLVIVEMSPEWSTALELNALHPCAIA